MEQINIKPREWKSKGKNKKTKEIALVLSEEFHLIGYDGARYIEVPHLGTWNNFKIRELLKTKEELTKDSNKMARMMLYDNTLKGEDLLQLRKMFINNKREINEINNSIIKLKDKNIQDIIDYLTDEYDIIKLKDLNIDENTQLSENKFLLTFYKKLIKKKFDNKCEIQLIDNIVSIFDICSYCGAAIGSHKKNNDIVCSQCGEIINKYRNAVINMKDCDEIVTIIQ